jgi:hypothetical protein
MTDLRSAKILSHRRNIQRYARLLATELTDVERQYLHKRIAEEQAELERWAFQSPELHREGQHPTGGLATDFVVPAPAVKNDVGTGAG